VPVCSVQAGTVQVLMTLTMCCSGICTYQRDYPNLRTLEHERKADNIYGYTYIYVNEKNSDEKN
jgi:hypothetical protein